MDFWRSNMVTRVCLSGETWLFSDSLVNMCWLLEGVLSDMSRTSEKLPMTCSVSFMVGTTEFAVPLSENIDVEAELEKLRAELIYLEGFLKSVEKKLSNERFVQNAKAEIVDNERKKLADAESKIVSIKENIEALESK